VAKKKAEQPFNNPFAGLKLPRAPAPAAAAPPAVKAGQPRSEAAGEAELFLEAVGAVEPVRRGPQRVPPRRPPSADELRIADEEAESLTRLAELVSGAGAFDLADSDEFVEGAVQGFDERVMRKLRAGEFATRAHLDLHGLTKDEAKLALERFIDRARIDGHRCVLVVTGRGLHSKDQVPVLKQGVQQWLSRGRLSRHVLAFCTARPADGGAGAVYVLLRR
jgi:DNA-nicking Smr family endonuclease